MIRIYITTDDGELLETIEVDYPDDPLYPIGRSMARAAICAEIEDAARIVLAREEKKKEAK